MHQRQLTFNSKKDLSRRKVSVDSGLSISGDLEKISLKADCEAESVLIEKLKRENAKLKGLYEDLRVQYVQLLEEAKEEKFEERRVNLLKAQVMQLERQVVLLSEGLSSQVCRCHDVEKALDPLTHKLRSLLSAESTGADVVISRMELTQLFERCEDVRQKLRRNNKVTSPEDLTLPWMLSGSKLSSQPTTLLDLCYSKTDHLNLQQVSALESRLSQLFKHLHGVRQTLCLILAPCQVSHCPPAVPSPPTAVYARLLNQAQICCAALDQCCLDLLTLSLIIPSAPWSGPKQELIQELEADNILAVLPPVPRGAPLQRARRAAQALSQAANYSLWMSQQQVESLQDELAFHRSLYSLQVRTVEELVQGIRQAYQVFQENISQSLCAPLQEVLSCYEDLRSAVSESALQRFLSAFKSNVAQIREAVEAFGPSKSEGDDALAQYGHDLLQTVESLLKEVAEKRETAASQLHSLQQEQQQAVDTLRTLRAQRKEAGSDRVQVQMACAESTQCDGPTVSQTIGRAEKTKAEEAAGVKKTRDSSTLLLDANQKPKKEVDGHKKRGSFKSRKVEPRPEWQD